MSESTDRRITAVKEQSRGRRRVNVFLDGSYAFSVERATALAHGLRPGLVLGEEQVERLRAVDAREQAHEAALRLLSFRPRSERELRLRLGKKGFSPQIVDETLTRLAQAGLADDHAFAEFWVTNRQTFRPRGARVLQQELRAKGIDRDVIDGVLAEHPVDEEHEAEQAARRKLSSLSGCDYPTFRRRLGSHLSRLGYSWETASTVMRRLWEESRGECAAEGEE